MPLSFFIYGVGRRHSVRAHFPESGERDISGSNVTREQALEPPECRFRGVSADFASSARGLVLLEHNQS